jgi:hypothetical protein
MNNPQPSDYNEVPLDQLLALKGALSAEYDRALQDIAKEGVDLPPTRTCILFWRRSC